MQERRAQHGLTGRPESAISPGPNDGVGEFMTQSRKIVALCALIVAGQFGCVERRFVIESDPPGAVVFVNGQPLGSTPVDGHFIYYGNYDFSLVEDGYETLHVDQRIRAPWYQYPLV